MSGDACLLLQLKSCSVAKLDVDLCSDGGRVARVGGGYCRGRGGGRLLAGA